MKLINFGALSLALASDDFRITKCDNDGLVEMTVVIKPSAVFFLPEGFSEVKLQEGETDQGDPIMVDIYKRVFSRAELTPTFEDGQDGKHLIMSVDISENSKGYKWRDQVVYDHSGHHLSFVCKYDMGDRTVKDDFTIEGHDFEATATNTGNLGYTLKVLEENYEIGSTVTFEIEPKNADLVYASLKSCDVFKGTALTNGATIIGVNGEGQDADMCVNPVIKSQLTHFSSMGKLSGSWTSFKWRTDIQNKIEDQTLQCEIALSTTKSTLTPTSCIANAEQKNTEL